jgi:hypothetical protein
MVTVWFLLALIAFPDLPAINYKGYYAYHTKEDCEIQKMSLENFIVESQMMKGLKTAIYVETFCLEMQAFPDQLKRYEKEKDRGIRLDGQQLGGEA